MNPTVTALMQKPPAEISAFLSGIYEHSAWVAEELCQMDNVTTLFTTVSALAAAMKVIVDGSSREKKMELLCAHPDLCEKVGKLESLTQESQEEQSGSGLQSLTAEEIVEFNKMNDAYRTKCGFPFILAVRNATKQTVLSGLQGRLKNSVQAEFVIAMQQVHKIAWMRLLSKINTEDAEGFLTCHVLDTGNGIPGKFSVGVASSRKLHSFLAFDIASHLFVAIRPRVTLAAEKMRITLERLSPPESAGVIGEFVTNDDGRLEGGPALKGGKEFTVGVYEWTFYVGDVRSSTASIRTWLARKKVLTRPFSLSQYFASKGTYAPGQPFLDVIPLRFGIDNPDDHYHVPLLVSPWSFSTYRGS
jgi:2-oxo-4-hydroxy-4-carboxy-5-ureidoimidazoline decarboxylase